MTLYFIAASAGGENFDWFVRSATPLGAVNIWSASEFVREFWPLVDKPWPEAIRVFKVPEGDLRPGLLPWELIVSGTTLEDFETQESTP